MANHGHVLMYRIEACGHVPPFSFSWFQLLAVQRETREQEKISKE
jgi:hypothetical protein